MADSGGTEKPVFLRAVTKDEITLRCEMCDKLAQWIATSRVTGETSAYCGEDVRMFLSDPNFEVPPELRR